MQAWEQALELRTETAEWWRSGIGRRFGANWSAIRKENTPTPTPIDETERMKLLFAAPFFITKGMVDLLDHAQKSFPTTPLRPVDLPVHAGFALLERPLEVIDLHGEALPWQAFTWGIAAGSSDPETAVGIHLSIYAHRNADPARLSAEQQIRMTFPTLALIHETAWTFDHDYAGESSWGTGTLMNEGVPITDEAMASGIEMLRTIHTFFILSWQKIAEPTNAQASRPVRKRAMKLDPNRPIPDVRVVQLRRHRQKGEHDGEHGSIEYTHRFLVSGHWRKQWYPSEQRHKPKWIFPYIKGPEDRPFQAKNTTYLWRR
jgi:hypothetical protein